MCQWLASSTRPFDSIMTDYGAAGCILAYYFYLAYAKHRVIIEFDSY